MTAPEDSMRIVDIELDHGSIVRWNPEIDHERKVAIFDLLERNHFAPANGAEGPFNLRLAIQENRLVIDLRDASGTKDLGQITLPIGSLRRLIKEYFGVCQSYFDAIKSAGPSQIEALDMGRRGLHDEGSERLRERLADKVEIDFDTARRLFTLICVLHIRG